MAMMVVVTCAVTKPTTTYERYFSFIEKQQAAAACILFSHLSDSVAQFAKSNFFFYFIAFRVHKFGSQ